MIRNFPAVVVAIGNHPGVSKGKMFGAEGLKIGKRVFAMEVHGKLVVKLSIARAMTLCKLANVSAFDPGHGRLMKQWVSVAPRAKLDWIALATESLEFVAMG
jgi:hypothetical protein